jgi:hypothetical protein
VATSHPRLNLIFLFREKIKKEEEEEEEEEEEVK